MKLKRGWVFISDEGFGHIVRQEAIIKEILKRRPDLELTVQTGAKLGVLKEKLGTSVEYRERYNNIHTLKSPLGGLDLKRTREIVAQYPTCSQEWLEEHRRLQPEFDFCISDFVPEAFDLCASLQRPAFGVAHFTWDWLFSRLYPELDGITSQMKASALRARALYFPPFTPSELLEQYANVARSVSFVINEFSAVNVKPGNGTTCLIMDNGTNTLTQLIESTLPQLELLPEIRFFLATDNLSEQAVAQVEKMKNVVPIRGLKTMHSYIPHVNFVLARGGFNTLTECLISKTPALLVEEDANPEVSQNVALATRAGYAARFRTTDFGPHFTKRIRHFLTHERASITQNLLGASFQADGAKEIAEDILKQLEAL